MSTIFEAIECLNEIKGKSDTETHRNIKRVIGIMEGQVHKKWPSSNLCKIVFKMSAEHKQLFLDILKDMDEGLIEHFDSQGE